MKNLFFAAALLMSSSTFASDSVYYSAEFEITKISPMCPASVPGGAVCAGLGSIVEIVATIDCNDQMVSFKTYEDTSTSLVTELHVMNVVRRGNRTRFCFAPVFVKKTVTVFNVGPVVLVNDQIQ